MVWTLIILWGERGKCCALGWLQQKQELTASRERIIFSGGGWHVVSLKKKKEQRTSHRLILCTWRLPARDQFSTEANCVASLHSHQFAAIGVRRPSYTHIRTHVAAMGISECRSSTNVNAAIRGRGCCPVGRHLLPAAFPISHPIVFKLWNRMTFFLHRIIHNVWNALSFTKKRKAQNCLPPNLFISSQELLQDLDPLKSNQPSERERQICASDRERLSTSRIFLSLAPSER